jgi:protein TonB
MKKIVFIFFFAVICLMAKAQVTLYFDGDGKAVSSLQEAKSYVVIIPDSTDNQKAVVRCYDVSGQIVSEDRFSVFKEIKNMAHFKEWLSMEPLRWSILNTNHKRDGKHKEWYASGQLHVIVDYVDGLRSGFLLSYWKNGQLKRRDVYDNGKFVKGQCFDSLGKEIPYYEYVIMPKFIGECGGIGQYLSKNIRYPVKAQENRIEGRVIVKFIVNTNGTISNVEVEKKIHASLDAEAYRVVSGLTKWIPGQIDGEKVNVPYVLPVNFKME